MSGDALWTLNRYETVRLPAPLPGEDGPHPITVMDAAGHVLGIYEAAAFKARYEASGTCPHGRDACYACRFNLPAHPARRAPAQFVPKAEPVPAA